MKWEDKRVNEQGIFDELYIGDIFVLIVENIICIKITEKDAFDICNDTVITVEPTEMVESRKATLVLE